MSSEEVKTTRVTKLKEYIADAEAVYVAYTKELEGRNNAVKPERDPREDIFNLARLLFDLDTKVIEVNLVKGIDNSLKELADQRKLPELPKND